jgi:glycosyltransferase involved in cell wall biosynthesis
MVGHRRPRTTCLAVTHETQRRSNVPPRRVLVIHPAMAPYRSDLFNLLAKRVDLRVLFIHAVPSYDADLRREDLARGLECDWRVLADGCRRPMASLPWIFRREVVSFRPDVVVTHEFGWASVLSMLMPVASSRVGRVLWTSRSAEQLAALSAIRRFAVRTLAPMADALLAYSAAVSGKLAAVASIPESRIFLCANQQDSGRLRNLAATARGAALKECRRRGLASRPLIVTIGRLVDIKDVANTIRGFAGARHALRQAALVVIGDGPLRPSLERLARELGVSTDVAFLGHLSAADVQAWLSLASVTVLASLVEPYGAVVAEGLAHGVPCICSKAAGASVLIDSWSRGMVIQPGDASLMENAMMSRSPDLHPAADLAVRCRDDLRPLTVLDDAAGFLAAVDHAAEHKRDC